MVTRYGELSSPFGAAFVDTVRKGSRTEDYVNHAVVTDRLNRLVRWTFDVREVWTYQSPDGRHHVDGVLVRMTIGDEYRDEAGGTDRATTFGEELQVSISDALKRAAMRFGVAIQLWHELPDVGTEAQSPPQETRPSVPTAEPGVSTATQPQLGEGAGGLQGPPGSAYLTAEEAAQLKADIGAGGLKVAHDRYGDHVKRWVDITHEQAAELRDLYGELVR